MSEIVSVSRARITSVSAIFRYQLEGAIGRGDGSGSSDKKDVFFHADHGLLIFICWFFVVEGQVPAFIRFTNAVTERYEFQPRFLFVYDDFPNH